MGKLGIRLRRQENRMTIAKNVLSNLPLHRAYQEGYEAALRGEMVPAWVAQERYLRSVSWRTGTSAGVGRLRVGQK
jgi:hypothetical protein